MKTSFKRVAAWVLAMLMILSCATALATGDGETVTEYADDVFSASMYSVTTSTSDDKITGSDGSWTIPVHYYDAKTGAVTHSGDSITISTGNSYTISANSFAADLAEIGGTYRGAKLATGAGEDAKVSEGGTIYAKSYGRYTTYYYLATSGGSGSRNDNTKIDNPESYAIYVGYELRRTYVVNFRVGAKAEEAGVTVAPSSIAVKSGETIAVLPEPSAWVDGDTHEALMAFAGWYTDVDCTIEFTSVTLVSSDLSVYAKWVGISDENDLYYVNFMNRDGSVVLATKAVQAEKPVTPYTNVSANEGEAFIGWSLTPQGEFDAANFAGFDFAQNISGVVEGNTLNLYAWFDEAYSVNFIANGGKAVQTQYVRKNGTAIEPATSREGYIFDGWYSDKDLTARFDFTTAITANTVLYAKWTADMVKVTLVYMYQNADDDGYTPAAKNQIVYAPAGSYLSIVKSNITSLGQTHQIGYAWSIDGDASANNAMTSATGSVAATLPDISDKYYQYASSTNRIQVMPDGSSNMLVYYDRVMVTLTFNYDLTERTGSMQTAYNSISAEAKDHYATSYRTKSSDKQFEYSFTARYGERISDVWPQVSWVVETGLSQGKEAFYGWETPSTTPQVSNVFTLVPDLFPEGNLKIVDGKLVATYTLSAVISETDLYYLIYARTTLPNETPDFTYNGNNYTIYLEACQQAKGGNYFGYKDLDGCTRASTNKFGKKYKDIGTRSTSLDDIETCNDKYMKEVFNDTFSSFTIQDDDRCQILLYDRNTVTLTLHVNDDTYGTDPQQKSGYLSGEKIYDDDADLLKAVDAAKGKANYKFAGWFTTDTFVPGTEYVPDENSVISGNMELWAKWEPSQFTAEFYLYLDDKSPYHTEGFAEGGKISYYPVPASMSNFLGWYYYNKNGELVAFDFSAEVGEAYTENGVLKLYGKWTGDEGIVSYLPGEGGDNETQTVVDPTGYAINEASVQLKDPSVVWAGVNVPNDSTLTFVGWLAPNGVVYQPGRYVRVTRQYMQFTALWSNDAVTLTYEANGGLGSDVVEHWARGSEASIWDNMVDDSTPHFTRDGYELIGWDKNAEAKVPTYRLGEGTITLSDNTTLYAIWKRKTTDVTLTKHVAGNMGDVNKDFNFTIKAYDTDGTEVNVYSEDGQLLSSATLKNGQSVKICSVPIGGKLVITETDVSDADYVKQYTVDDGEIFYNAKNGAATVAIQEGTHSIDFTNTKNVIPDTGVVLDSLPYIVILAVVVLGVVLMVRKRRHDDD